MSFCFNKTIKFKDWRVAKTVMDGAQRHGFEPDQSYGGFYGGWARYIRPIGCRNEVYPNDLFCITAPGARWIQVNWRHCDEGRTEGTIGYSVEGLQRHQREQHERDLAPRVRVRLWRRGPAGECAEWMAQYHQTRGYSLAPTIFEGTQIETVTRFASGVWVWKWHPAKLDREQPTARETAFPFQGYWEPWYADMKLPYIPGSILVPEPAVGAREIENMIAGSVRACAMSLTGE